MLSSTASTRDAGGKGVSCMITVGRAFVMVEMIGPLRGGAVCFIFPDFRFQGNRHRLQSCKTIPGDGVVEPAIVSLGIHS